MARDALDEDRETSPEEAKAVWDSLEHPTIEKVHQRLIMSGKKVKLTDIAYWHGEDWLRKAPIEDVIDIAVAVDEVDSKVPLVTGNPRNGVKSLVKKDEKALLPDRPVRHLSLAQRLEAMPDDKLLRQTIRQGLIATSIIFKEAQQQRSSLLKSSPVELGSLMKSLADVLEKCTDCADRSASVGERLIRAEEMTEQRTLTLKGGVVATDPLTEALNEFERERTPAPAAQAAS